MDLKTRETYSHLLNTELEPAFGCTEPIALAYAAAIARFTLGKIPEKIEIAVSSNIIKNVKSVIVPGTNGMTGIKAAVAAGAIGGKAEKKLEVISEITEEQKKEIKEYTEKNIIKTLHADSKWALDIQLRAFSDEDEVFVRIVDTHTNVILVEKNGKTLFHKDYKKPEEKDNQNDDKKTLNIKDIYEYANTVDLSEIEDVLNLQIQYNTKIAEEGISHDYGANIGSTLLKMYGSDDVKIRAKAMAAAASDARMSGCELPVVINAGSGNQGITLTLPLVEYAKELKADHDKLLRALAFSNLAAMHEKYGIGTLSAYCGVITAGCAAGGGIAYLYDCSIETIEKTISNGLAINSGIICDGAKPSCAAKINSAVDAGILGFLMAYNSQEFKPGEGIVKDGIESTIAAVGKLGRDGMRDTDREIINIMIGD